MDGSEQTRVQHIQGFAALRGEECTRPRVIAVKHSRYQHQFGVCRQLSGPCVQHRSKVGAMGAGIGEYFRHFDHARRQLLIGLPGIDQIILHTCSQPRQGLLGMGWQQRGGQ